VSDSVYLTRKGLSKLAKVNDWNDVINVLYLGAKDDIMSLRCPECGGVIEYHASVKYSTFEVKCLACGLFFKRARHSG